MVREMSDSIRERVIDRLVSNGVFKSNEVIRAMKTVPREAFVPDNLRNDAYYDTPLPIGYKQTISAIHMVGIMAETLELQKGYKVLEIGSGSGYHAAVVAEIVSPKGSEIKGHVYTVEIISELANFAERNLAQTGYLDRVTVINDDGSKGYPKHAPYDRIQVTASAPRIPKPLISQLKIGGLLVIPVGNLTFGQSLLRIRKISEKDEIRENLGGVAFVPLVGEHGWKI